MGITRLIDILPHAKATYPEQKTALAGKRSGEWRTYSIDEYVSLVDKLSYALLHLGVRKGDKIALISDNCPEWNIIDMAVMQLGAITVPIYPTISAADYSYILTHSEATLLFIEEHLMYRVASVLPQISTIKEVFVFSQERSKCRLYELYELGEANTDEQALKTCKDNVLPEDVACIIYTSGTTGNPKGVMLSHHNVVSQLLSLEDIPSSWNKVAFSFLPLCHAYEKMLVYLYQYLGMSVYYAESLATITENLHEVNPTMMTCVPRILDKIYDKLYQTGKKQRRIQRKLYFWAFNLATRYRLEKFGFFYRIQHKIADKFIYSKWRQAIGGHFDIVVSGSAAIQPHVAAFFSAIGMPVFEGYGLTETSPVIAVSNRSEHGRKFGTVGPPLKGVEVKIGDNNEILCRGHNVMLGYYKEPELTKEVIDKEGWFRTGDTGYITEEGQVVITGRLKSIFKTSFGKYVNPQLIEEKFMQSPFIENMMVLGENQKFAAALIVPDFVYLKAWTNQKGINYTAKSEILENKQVKELFAKEVKKYNAFLGDTEKIKKYKLIADEWTQGNNILTPTLKVKRRIVQEEYKKEIKELFE